MDYQKFVGMRIWVPSAGDVDAKGHNAEICWVHHGGSTPDRINVNARNANGLILHNVVENITFFWERPVTSRPFVEKQIFVNVYKERDGRYTTGGVHFDGKNARVQAEASPAHLITLTGTIMERK